MFLTEEDTRILVDHEDAIMRIATVVAQCAIDSDTLSATEADDFVDEIAELLGFDMEELEITSHPVAGSPYVLGDGLVA